MRPDDDPTPRDILQKSRAKHQGDPVNPLDVAVLRARIEKLEELLRDLKAMANTRLDAIKLTQEHSRLDLFAAAALGGCAMRSSGTLLSDVEAADLYARAMLAELDRTDGGTDAHKDTE